ncbi:MAG TPA: 16S rRNA (guanine(966)-N(2))-methyltransferase RsmD [Kiritimatiellia bacterium]|jgi:16S rRNA (guanine966-N2)-methyltransferase|nr:16S rRNA (guanine(966)-N(2))-methyltransferase RsmD [Kiritimatiellia bacterium]MBP9572053.1 16S rRNA (guanine(966)-N(2))-methyltransferase RsmD [Kiritimatiellia bacterium]OQC53506.1 MAG: Ribosomal RNA small subunit methyltransferase D [Verrucomicrobia bacterium ADurb.Bin018]HPV46615.1 16S rRNA (guanine(966)-N(2))-methyltransferase RsmD [Kiritimatiellia bacterium]HQM22415.1 16S rRNA (guanine(966)-N(2))-methyltransferase RsmD [Kiritimatiellia bacterium]
MRLTGGSHGGRLLTAAGADIRPTQDKVRAAIFSTLASVIPGARVLDLFAGSGALGLEAWSRGAAWVEWVECGKPALRCLRANLQALQVPPDAGRIVVADVFSLLSAPYAGAGFDLVLADPPYELAKEQDWEARIAAALGQSGWLRPGGFWVWETEGKAPPREFPGWTLLRDRAYGATRVLLRRKHEE